MTAFTFTSPEGKSYTVNGPEGATKEQAFAVLQSQLTGGKAADDAAPAAAAPAPDNRGLLEKTGDAAYAGLQGLGGAFHSLGTTLATAGGAFPVVYDKLHGAVDGQDHTEAEDAYFANVLDPMVERQKAFDLGPNASLAEKIAHGAGTAAGVVSQAALTGPEAIAGQGAARAAAQGAQSMMIPATSDAVDRARQVLEAGHDESDAAKAAAAQFILSTASGAVPAALPGRLATRIVTGAGIGAAQNEANRVVMNAALPDDMHQDSNTSDDVAGAALGAFFGARHGSGHDTAAAPGAGDVSSIPQNIPVADQLIVAAGDTPDSLASKTPAIAAARQAVDAQRTENAQKLEASITDPHVSLDDTIKTAQALAARPQDDVALRGEAMSEWAKIDARNKAAQAVLDGIGSPENTAAEQARLEKLREAIDMHGDLVEHANAQANTTARDIAQTNALDPLQDLGNRTSTEPVDTRTAKEIAATTNDPVLKQLYMDRIRDDAGMTPGARTLTSENADLAAPSEPLPGLTRPDGAARIADANTAPPIPFKAPGLRPNARPIGPKWIDLRPMTPMEGAQRLAVLQDQARTAGADPRSMQIVTHPGDPTKVAIVSNDTAHTYDPAAQGNKAPEPVNTDPVKLYVDAHRATNTPASQAFVRDYDAGHITDQDVQRAMVAQKRTADTVDQNMTSAGNVLERAGRDSLPMKPRGESPERDATIAADFARTPRDEPSTPPPDEPGAPPPVEPPTTDKPLSDQEMLDRLPVADDNHALRTAVRRRSVATAAEHLAKSPNPILARVGELSRTLAGKTTFIPWPTEARLRQMVGMGSDRVGGFYDPRSDEIAMREQRTVKGRLIPSNEGSDRVVGHELMHAITSWAVHNPTPEQAPHIAELTKLFRHVSKELKGESHYGLTNLHEFLSEAFSKPEFQVRLSKIKYGTTTAWSQFVHSIAKLLGFKESNALTEVLRLGEAVGQTKRRSNVISHQEIHASEDDKPAHELSTTADPRFKFARNLPEAVRHAANTSGEFGKTLADLVTPHIQNTTFKVLGKSDPAPLGLNEEMKTARGLFQKSIAMGREGVWVKGADHGPGAQGVNNETVLHEALHAATARKVWLGEQPMAKGTLLGTHVRELDKLRGHVVEQWNAARRDGTLPADLERVGPTAFGDNKEFISYGLTHKPVQDFLKSIPGVFNRTAWGDFVAKVRDVLGMDAKHTSALADLLDLTHRITATHPTPELRALELERADRGLAHRSADGQNGDHEPDQTNPIRVDRLPRGAGEGAGRPERGPLERPDSRAADSTEAGTIRPAEGDAAGGAREAVRAGAGGQPRVPAGAGDGERGQGSAGPRVDATSQPLSPEAQRGAGAPAAVAVSHVARIGGRALDAMKGFGAKLGLKDIVDENVSRAMPMSAAEGTDRARAQSKDYANKNRLAQAQWMRFDSILKRNYTKAQREAMWNAADDENLVRSEAAAAKGADQPYTRETGRGLDALPADQRATVETLHHYAEELLARGQGVGMFPDGGLPYWTPRMAVMIGSDGEISRPDASGTIGVDITTSASSAKTRKYLTAEETEAAQKKLLDSGDKSAKMVRDIRTMPLAMARLERAIAGRELVESIRKASTDGGFNAVSDHPAEGFFTLDHPAFTTYSPTMTRDPKTGKTTVAVDQFGNTVMRKQPLYIRNEYKGPLQSILYDAPGKTYSALMAIKREATSLIMYSPVIHNQVIFGKALSAVKFNPAKLISLYAKGNALRTGVDFSTMREAINNGMAPIGNFGAKQDITDIAGHEGLEPGQGWKSRVLGDTVGLVHKGAGEAVKSAIDTFGHFWHNTLLWDRVADLQMGLYAHAKAKNLETFRKQGLDPAAADRAAGLLAAHFANRYAGALPNEAMSGAMRKFANLTLFSRSFTLGNLALYKDAVTGLPADVRSQLSQQFGTDAASVANKAGRRQAAGTLVLEMGALYVMNSLLQDAMKAYRQEDDEHGFWSNMADQLAKYGPRAQAALEHARNDPMDVLPVVGHPFKFIHSFTSNGGNEPGKESRIRGPNMADGTATYYRSPLGKVGEDLEGWMSAPLQTLWSKVGTLVKPAVEVGMQVAGHPADGKNLWAPSDSTLTAMGKATAHFMAGQLPVQDVKVVADLIRSSPNGNESTKEQEADHLKKLKLLLPLATGVTVSRGFPGGPAQGAAFHASQDAAATRANVMPQVHQLVQTGDPADRAEAVKLMTSIGMTPPQMISYLKGQLAPASRLTAQRIAVLARTNPTGLAAVREAQANEE